MVDEKNRLEELEIRIAHQDRAIADLNDVITSQWKKLETLERQLRRLGEEVASLDPGDAPPNQKPPHY